MGRTSQPLTPSFDPLRALTVTHIPVSPVQPAPCRPLIIRANLIAPAESRMTKKAKRAFETFVEEIPDDKLQPPFSDAYGTIYTNKHFRLDMQGTTAEGWNLQIQANLQSTEKQVRELSPNTVSQLTVPSRGDAGWAVEEIRAMFRSNSEFEKPGGLDIERLSIRSNRSSLRSIRGAKAKVKEKFRDAMREVKNQFRHEGS